MATLGRVFRAESVTGFPQTKVGRRFAAAVETVHRRATVVLAGQAHVPGIEIKDAAGAVDELNQSEARVDVYRHSLVILDENPRPRAQSDVGGLAQVVGGPQPMILAGGGEVAPKIVGPEADQVAPEQIGDLD